MFQFTGFAPIARWYVFNISGCPIRISADQFICANPRSFSQLITSFIASESLGIHHTPLFSFLCFLLFIIVLYVHCCTYRNNKNLTFYYFDFLRYHFFNMSMNLWNMPSSFKLLNEIDFPLWRISESNRWPPACKAGALASWANPPF
jgi:hypothetical protein